MNTAIDRWDGKSLSWFMTILRGWRGGVSPSVMHLVIIAGLRTPAEMHGLQTKHGYR